MKNLFRHFTRLLLPAMFLLALAVCREKTQKPPIAPAAYNDSIVALQFAFNTRLTAFMEAVSLFDTAAIRQAYDSLEATASRCRATLDSLPQVPAYDFLRQPAAGLFDFYRETIRHEYRDIVSLLLRPPEQITPQDLARIDSVNREITRKEQELEKAFRTAQDSFARRYNLELIVLPADTLPAGGSNP